MPDTDVSRTHQSSAKRALAALNDALRTDTTNPGHNRIMMTAGVAALICDVTRFRGFQKRAELLRAVRDYDNFDIDNDPYGERDYGIFERSEEHTSELQSLMRISYAVFCLKKKINK